MTFSPFHHAGHFYKTREITKKITKKRSVWRCYHIVDILVPHSTISHHKCEQLYLNSMVVPVKKVLFVGKKYDPAEILLRPYSL